MKAEDTWDQAPPADGNFRCGRATLRTLRTPTSDDNSRPLRVAVTGGIGSGKTTFAQALRPYALAYADADQIAREIVAPGQPAVTLIAQRFGAHVINPDGSLNRPALASVVFSDEAARSDLEKITHPLIAQRAEEILAISTQPGFVVYDVPLLRTCAEAEKFDEVIVVTAPFEARLERLENRGISRADALARINSQMSDSEREQLATIVVANDGSAKDLQAIARTLAATWQRSS